MILFSSIKINQYTKRKKFFFFYLLAGLRFENYFFCEFLFRKTKEFFSLDYLIFFSLLTNTATYLGMAAVGFLLLPGWYGSRKNNDDINMVDVRNFSDPYNINIINIIFK